MMDAHIQLVNIKGCAGAIGFKPPKGFEDRPWNLTGDKMKIGRDAYLFQQSRDSLSFEFSPADRA
jgi:hypothetical protein